MPRGFWHPKLVKQRIPLADRFWAKVEKSDGPLCWLWLGTKNAQGYGAVSLPGGKRMGRAHRVSWELTNGKIPEGLDVLHRCDNPSCVRPDHLFLGDDKANMLDAKAKGRLRPGRPQPCEAHPSAKLKNEDIATIVADVRSGDRRGCSKRRVHAVGGQAIRSESLSGESDLCR